MLIMCIRTEYSAFWINISLLIEIIRNKNRHPVTQVKWVHSVFYVFSFQIHFLMSFYLVFFFFVYPLLLLNHNSQILWYDYVEFLVETWKTWCYCVSWLSMFIIIVPWYYSYYISIRGSEPRNKHLNFVFLKFITQFLSISLALAAISSWIPITLQWECYYAGVDGGRSGEWYSVCLFTHFVVTEGGQRCEVEKVADNVVIMRRCCVSVLILSVQKP